jgi:ElaB/YqjD/DUF883 family membrane-anchored ribosome-binding protein
MTQVNALKRTGPKTGGANLEESVRLADFQQSNPTVRTHATASRALNKTGQPQSGDRIEGGRVTPPPVRAMVVENAASSAGVGSGKRMPDFAFAVIKVATAREAYGSEKLKALAEQVREQLKDVDHLLDLSSELTVLPDKDSHDLTDKMRDLIGRLEVHKIQVWKGGGKLSKENLNEMKAHIGSQIDKLRTSIQTKISTEIQPEANNLQSIMNIIQQIIQSDARLKRKTAEIPR